MIQLQDIFKVYSTRSGHHTVLSGVSFAIKPGERIGILGRNGAGKSTLIRILAGAEQPTSGKIHRKMSLSWPLAFSGGFQGSLTGLDNLKFICRVYGVDHRSKVDFVTQFAELGKFFREPVKTYSSGMRSRLAFAISMAVEFDCFLIDEIFAVGDARFHEKCKFELLERRADRAKIIVSHQISSLREHCDQIKILHDSKLITFQDSSDAYEFYVKHC